MNRNNLPCILIIVTTMILTSCKHHIETLPSLPPPPPPVVEYSINIPGENLMALTKITESEYKCRNPYGGDNNRKLFFTVSTYGSKIYSNIFEKENVLGVGMSQKTSGNNNNTYPTYCAATDMLAIRTDPPSTHSNNNNNSKPSYSVAYHLVQSGETITDIARRYGITVKDIVRWNN